MLKGNEIRKLFLEYFEKKRQHTVVESSSLVPDNPTVLLTTAGMLQFLPIFLNIQRCPYEPARATSCQKCARAGGKDSDIIILGRFSDAESALKARYELICWLQSEAFGTFEMPKTDKGGDA